MTAERLATLTHRELDILRRVARGDSKKQIATGLVISVHTVNRHATTLMAKLGLGKMTHLALFAVKFGVLGIDEAWRWIETHDAMP